MAHLQLNLISGSGEGQNDVCRFTSLGGTIGRSNDCDWTLYDSDRYISNKHIAVSFHNNQFVLTDVSSNGVFINKSQVLLGKPNTHTLRVGDKITLGKFCIEVVELVNQAQNIGDEDKVLTSQGIHSPSQQNDLLDLVTDSKRVSRPSAPLPSETPSGSGADLGLFDILTGNVNKAVAPQLDYKKTNSQSNLYTDPEPAHFIPTPPLPSLPTAQDVNNHAHNTHNVSFNDTHKIPEDWDLESPHNDDVHATNNPNIVKQGEAGSLAKSEVDNPAVSSNYSMPEVTQSQTHDPELRLSQPPQNIPEEAPLPELKSQTDDALTAKVGDYEGVQNQANHDDFFALLYEKLGLPKEYLATVNQARFAEDLVDILMTSTKGIMSLLAGRSVFKQESRLSMTMIKPQSNNPIKFSLDPSDTLEMLLVKKKPGYKTAQDSYTEALNDIQLHQMAFLSGLQATLSGVLGELKPTELEKIAAQKGKSFIGMQANARNWDTFKQKQDMLDKEVNENLNDILSRHFSDAYEAQINSIKSR